MKSTASDTKRNSRQITTSFAVIPTLLMLLSGCDKQPGGQVVAVVNSDEITQTELKAEAEGSGLAPDADTKSIAPAMLERLIERNVLADYAREQGLDRGPGYVARRRQLEQTLLATLAMRKLLGTPPAPSPTEVQAYIAANPALFQKRQRLTLDQVRFAAPGDAKQVKALDSLGSPAAVEARLRTQGVPVARGTATLDTGTIEPSAARQIAALPDGQLFDLTINGTTFISAITGRTPVTVPAAAITPAATQLVARQQAAKTLGDAVGKLRQAAKITYDPAYKPATTKK